MQVRYVQRRSRWYVMEYGFAITVGDWRYMMVYLREHVK